MREIIKRRRRDRGRREKDRERGREREIEIRGRGRGRGKAWREDRHTQEEIEGGRRLTVGLLRRVLIKLRGPRFGDSRLHPDCSAVAHSHSVNKAVRNDP